MPKRSRTHGQIDEKALIDRLEAKLAQLHTISPTTVTLFEEWAERLLAGETIDDLQPEFDRLLKVYAARRRHQD